MPYTTHSILKSSCGINCKELAICLGSYQNPSFCRINREVDYTIVM